LLCSTKQKKKTLVEKAYRRADRILTLGAGLLLFQGFAVARVRGNQFLLEFLTTPFLQVDLVGIIMGHHGTCMPCLSRDFF
jgi:hypothetical protein